MSTGQPLDREEYIEQVYFFRVFRERLQQDLAAQEILERLHEEILSTTRLPFAIQFLATDLKHTGIPVNFGITIAIALIVGIVVAGQTFYIFTIENLKQFGALKAIGVTNWRITRMIVLQALIVGAMGFSIGSGLCTVFFAITLQNMATRGMVLLWQNVVGTGVAIFIVIIIASLISIRRVLVLEPAAVFRG